MKSNFGKILVSLILCVGARGVWAATAGELRIPKTVATPGLDGCTPTVEIKDDEEGQFSAVAAKDKCKVIVVTPYSLRNGSCVAGDPVFTPVCNGDDGKDGKDGGCAPQVTFVSGQKSGSECMRAKVQPMAGDKCDTPNGLPTYSSYICPGKDACPDDVTTTDKVNGCWQVKTTKQERNASGECVPVSGTERYSDNICDGPVGPTGSVKCSGRIYATDKDSTTGCYDTMLQPQKWENGECVDDNTATAEKIGTTCDGQGPCYGLSGTSLVKTIKSTREARHTDPSAMGWNADGGFFTKVSQVQKYITYCDNHSETVSEPDPCKTTAFDIAKCPDGILEECTYSGSETHEGINSSTKKYLVCLEGSLPVPSCPPIIDKTAKDATTKCYNLTKQAAVYNKTTGQCEGTGTAENIGEVCDGTTTCADKIVVGDKNTTTGCYTTSYYHQTANSSGVCTPDAQAYDTKTTCDGGSGTGVCDVAASDKAKTVANQTKTYSKPTGYSSTNKYFTSLGGYNSVTTFCDDTTKNAFTQDDCTANVFATATIGTACSGTFYTCRWPEAETAITGVNTYTGSNDKYYYACVSGGVTPIPVCETKITQSDKVNGCYTMTAKKQQYNLKTKQCEDSSESAVERQICDGSTGPTGPQGPTGPTGPSACDLVASADLAKTTKTETKTYNAPTGASASAYATATGYMTVTTEKCSGTSTTVNIPDACTVVTAESANLPTAACAGVISKCVRGDNGNAYYMCADKTCQESKSVYTAPTAATGTDTNALNNKAYSERGYYTRTEKQGCGSNAATKNIIEYDECVTPVIKTKSGADYVYKTCTNPETNATYTWRVAVGSDDSDVYKMLKTAKTTADSLDETVNNASTGLVKQVSDNTTALDGKLNTADLGSTLTKAMITDKLGNNTYGSYSDVNSLKTTVGNSSSGLVKDVADAKSDASDAKTAANNASNTASAAQNTANAAQSAVSGKMDVTDFNKTMYGANGTESNPASGSIAYNANNAIQPGTSFTGAANTWLLNDASVSVSTGSGLSSASKSVPLAEFVVGMMNVIQGSGLCNSCGSNVNCSNYCQSMPINPTLER